MLDETFTHAELIAKARSGNGLPWMKKLLTRGGKPHQQLTPQQLQQRRAAAAKRKRRNRKPGDMTTEGGIKWHSGVPTRKG